MGILYKEHETAIVTVRCIDEFTPRWTNRARQVRFRQLNEQTFPFDPYTLIRWDGVIVFRRLTINSDAVNQVPNRMNLTIIIGLLCRIVTSCKNVANFVTNDKTMLIEIIKRLTPMNDDCIAITKWIEIKSYTTHDMVTYGENLMLEKNQYRFLYVWWIVYNIFFPVFTCSDLSACTFLRSINHVSFRSISQYERLFPTRRVFLNYCGHENSRNYLSKKNLYAPPSCQ